MFSTSVFSQNANSLNQQDKSKNAVGSNNKESNPKKSKAKVSNNKQGTFVNQNTDEDNLPVDTLNVTPAIIISNKKPNNN